MVALRLLRLDRRLCSGLVVMGNLGKGLVNEFTFVFLFSSCSCSTLYSPGAFGSCLSEAKAESVSDRIAVDFWGWRGE